LSAKTPLFLLTTVLMPDGVLALRVFESRYLDMVAHSMREDEPFAVVPVLDKGPDGEQPSEDIARTLHPASMGTLARIIDWDQGKDGVLQVVARGLQRVRIHDPETQADGLVIAAADPLDDDEFTRLPEDMGYLARGLEHLLDQLGPPYTDLARRPDDVAWVGNRLTEVLPMSLQSKQVLLETLDPMTRMQAIEAWIMSQQRGGAKPS